MDPFTQGALGAAFSQSFANNPKKIGMACLAGIAGGMAPDLDIVIQSSSDPLLFIEFHRHFTHSIWFIPFGGFLVAGFLWLIFRKIWNFKELYIFSTLGFATHALLDACTSYGTRLFWPVSNARVAWDTISIIDPIATIPLIIFVIFSVIKKSALVSRIGFGLFVLYLGLGFIQNSRVINIITETAASRGHNNIERIKLNPTLGNLIAWRTIYEFEGRYYVDAVIANPFSDTRVIKGSSVEKIDAETIFPTIANNSIARNDIRRFNYFSQGYIFLIDENKIGDLRYSGEPHKIEPIWGLIIDPNNDNKHVIYSSFRGPGGRALGTIWDMVTGNYKEEELLAP